MGTNGQRFEKKFIGQNDRRKGERNGNGQNWRREEPLQDFSRIYGTDRRNDRPYEQRLTPRRVDYNCALGIVERVPKEGKVNALPGYENKMAAVGYALYAEHTGERKPIFITFSSKKEWQFFWLDTKTGDISEEPLNYTPDGMVMGFKENPEPVYHRTFTPHDPIQPTHCFESHVRNIAGGRINEMRKSPEVKEEVRCYQLAVDDFLKKTADIFRKAGQY